MEHLGDRLYAYVIGTLPEQEAAEVEAHLRGCADCRTELEQARKLVEGPVDRPTTGAGACPNIAALVGFVLGRAAPRQSKQVEAHLLRCPTCRESAGRLEAQRAAGSLQPRDMVYEYLADVMRPLTEDGIPSDALLSGVDVTTITLNGTANLSLVAPVQTKRLAADSEAGFESCELAAEDGTLKAYVEQFGQMLRVRLECNVKDLRRGLAVAVFQEGATARMSVPLAVERGEAFGKVPASAPGFHRPERERYTVRVDFVRPPELVKALITYGVL